MSDYKDKYELAMRNLNEKAWEKMNLTEKQETLQNIENYRALVEERPAAQIELKDMNQDPNSPYFTMGEQQGDRISIDSSLSASDTRHTLNHETSHFQDYLAAVDPDYAQAHNYRDVDIRNLNDPYIRYDYNSHPGEMRAEYHANINDTEMQQQQQTLQEYDLDHHQNTNQIIYTPETDVLDRDSILMTQSDPDLFENLYDDSQVQENGLVNSEDLITDESLNDYSVDDSFEEEF